MTPDGRGNIHVPAIGSARGALSHDQLELIEAIWEAYSTAPGPDWPLASAIRLQLGRRRTIAALSSLTPGIVLVAIPGGDRYLLTLYGVFLSSSGKELFRLFVRFLDFLRTPEGRAKPRLRAAAVQDALQLSDRDATLLGKLIYLSWLRVGNSQLGPAWECGLPDNLDEIVELESVERYVEDEARRCAGDAARREGEMSSLMALGPGMSSSDEPIRLFISHSSADRELAERLTRLVRSALNLPATAIRCTSVDGYRLPGGADTDEQLRREVHDAEAFVGIVSFASLQSLYVLFELGARWGATKALIPLLAPGTSADALGGPLAGLNALRADSRPQLQQLIENVASTLGIEPQSPSSYDADIVNLLALPASRPILRQQSGADTPDTTVSVSGREILRRIAQAGGHRVPLDELERSSGVTPVRFHLMLDDLQAQDLIEIYNVVPEGDAVSLTRQGRAFVVENDLDT